MKVLHVYRHDNPRLAKYVSLLSQAMSADVECVFADNASDVRLAVKDFQPDIIHQHGQPIDNLRLDNLRCSTAPARLVISPHGETVDTSKAYVVIARSPYELTCHATERKELVRNPLITKTITFDEAAAAIHTVYQRVMDSHPLELMNASTRTLLAFLLKAGLLGDKAWVADNLRLDNLQFDNLRFDDLRLDDLRHLFIYVELEGVLDIVKRGIAVLGIYAPPKPTIDCYLPHGYKTPQPLPKATIPELLKDIDAHGLTLLRLTELMKQLHEDSLDEAALMEQLEADKRRPLFQLLLQILSEQTLLTEGFMPCTPLDNSYTENLRQQLENHLKL